MSITSIHASTEAESLLTQIAALDDLTACRSALVDLAAKLSERLDASLTTTRMTSARDEIAVAAENVDAAADRAASTLGATSFKLRRTRRRGVFARNRSTSSRSQTSLAASDSASSSPSTTLSITAQRSDWYNEHPRGTRGGTRAVRGRTDY